MKMTKLLKKSLCATKLGRWFYGDVYCYIRTKIERKRGCYRLRKYGPDILRKIHFICKEEGIPYFLNYGTLLGCVREHGFIRHDDDIDIGIFPSYTDLARLEERLSNEGFTFKRGFLYENKITEFTMQYKQVSVDFFVNFKEGTTLWAQCYATGGVIPHREQKVLAKKTVRTYSPLITTLRSYAMCGQAVVIPENFEDILRAQYGDGWKIKNPNWIQSEEGDYCILKEMSGEAYVIGERCFREFVLTAQEKEER